MCLLFFPPSTRPGFFYEYLNKGLGIPTTRVSTDLLAAQKYVPAWYQDSHHLGGRKKTTFISYRTRYLVRTMHQA